MLVTTNPKYEEQKELKLGISEVNMLCVGLELYRGEIEEELANGGRSANDREVLEALESKVFTLEAKLIGIEHQ